MVAQGYDSDIARTADHLNLRSEQVESALAYYSAYPEEINFTLSEVNQGFDRLKQLLPQIKQVIITDQDLANVTAINEQQ